MPDIRETQLVTTLDNQSGGQTHNVQPSKTLTRERHVKRVTRVRYPHSSILPPAFLAAPVPEPRPNLIANGQPSTTFAAPTCQTASHARRSHPLPTIHASSPALNPAGYEHAVYSIGGFLVIGIDQEGGVLFLGIEW